MSPAADVASMTSPRAQGRSDRYWAAEADPRSLIESLRKKRDDFWNLLDRMNIVNSVYRLWRFYHGLFFDTEGGSIVLGGQEYDISQLGVNEFRARLRLLLSLTTSDFDWDAQGTDDSQDTLEAVKIANAVEDWGMDAPQYRIGEALAVMKEQALIYRVGYVATLWDPTSGEEVGSRTGRPPMIEDGESLDYQYSGDAKLLNPTIFDTVFNPTLTFHRRPWVYFRERVSRFDQAELHFSKRADILSQGGKSEVIDRFYGMERGLVSQEYQDQDTIDKWWFFHLPTPSLKTGRLLCHVGDVDLYDGPFPSFYGYGNPRLPIARCVHSRMEGTDIIGYSPAVDLAPLQEALNIELSTILTNHRKWGQTKLWKQAGDDIQPQILEPGATILNSNTEIKVLDLLKDSPELIHGVDLILQRMDSVSGVSAASRGFADKAMPGIRAALDDQKTIQSNSDYDRNIRNAAQDVGQTWLEIWQEFAGQGREVPVVSEDDQIRLEKFSSEQMKMVRRMLVKPGNPALRTPSGRMQLVEYLMKLPDGLTNRQELLSVLEGAPLKRVTGPMDSQIRLAREENVKLRRGEQVVGSIADNHLLHALEVSEIIASTEARLNPAIVRVAMPHFLWHLNMLVGNPMAQAMMIAFGWADPQKVMALAQIGSLMLPAPMAGEGNPPPTGDQEGGGATILPGPGSSPQPVQEAQRTLGEAKGHLQREARSSTGGRG